MPERPRPRPGLLVVGVGSRLRGDDRVGIVLLERLQDFFGRRLDAVESPLPDVSLAPQIAAAERLWIIDSLAVDPGTPYRRFPVGPARDFSAVGGAVSHDCDWPTVLALAATVYGRAPRAEMLGVVGHRFGLSETLSPACRANAEAAFDFLVRHCAADGA